VQQITEAFPWNEAPRYLIRDRDGVYGPVVRRRLRAMRVSAEHKKLTLGRVSVEVRHGKVAADHCTDCGEVAEWTHRQY
jgi:hypothetical protein